MRQGLESEAGCAEAAIDGMQQAVGKRGLKLPGPLVPLIVKAVSGD